MSKADHIKMSLYVRQNNYEVLTSILKRSKGQGGISALINLLLNDVIDHITLIDAEMPYSPEKIFQMYRGKNWKAKAL